jgi:hypothetical protein
MARFNNLHSDQYFNTFKIIQALCNKPINTSNLLTLPAIALTPHTTNATSHRCNMDLPTPNSPNPSASYHRSTISSITHACTPFTIRLALGFRSQPHRHGRTALSRSPSPWRPGTTPKSPTPHSYAPNTSARYPNDLFVWPSAV